MPPMPRLKNGKRVALPGAHRTTRDKTAAGGAYYIIWRAWREKGAPVIGSFKGATRTEAEQAELDGAEKLAGEYHAARAPGISNKTLAGLLDLYEMTSEFKKCSPSTKAERSRLIKQMRNDKIPPAPGEPDNNVTLGSFPAAALKAPRARAVLRRWRDHNAETRGPRAADQRVELLRRCLAVMVDQGDAPENPALKLGSVHVADRSDLILEPAHVAKYLALIRKKIDAIWYGTSAKHPQRARNLTPLFAARDALLLAINNGQRREDLSCLNWRECTDVAFVYTARKGARRAKTAGKKKGVTVVPIMDEARRVLIYRREAYGATSPWVIVSSKGGAYTPNTLGELVNGLLRECGIDRTLHDTKGTFVTKMKCAAPWLSNAEVGEMVDWSEDEVDRIITRYLSADALAEAKIERLRGRRKTG